MSFVHKQKESSDLAIFKRQNLAFAVLSYYLFLIFSTVVAAASVVCFA